MKKPQSFKKKVERGATKPLEKHEAKSIYAYLKSRENWRDLALLCCGLDTMLRASDLVRLMVEEVADRRGNAFERARIRMKKTRDVVDVTMGDDARAAIEMWLRERPISSRWMFPGREPENHMTEVRYRQLAKGWFSAISLRPLDRYSTHSIRKTKAKAIYDDTKNLKAVSELLGHKDTKVTERYLGISRAEAIEISARVNVLR